MRSLNLNPPTLSSSTPSSSDTTSSQNSNKIRHKSRDSGFSLEQTFIECDSISSERQKLSNINPFSPSARKVSGRKRRSSQQSVMWVLNINFYKYSTNDCTNIKTKTSLWGVSTDQWPILTWCHCPPPPVPRIMTVGGLYYRQVSRDQVTPWTEIIS